MYDRNKGVQSIIKSQEKGESDNAKFNCVTGEISHNVPGGIRGTDWYWLVDTCYPMYSEYGEYIGYTINNFVFPPDNLILES